MDIVLIISYSLLGIAMVSAFVMGFCRREYYVIYHHNLLYVIGLVFSRSLTNNAVVNVLMWYLTSHYEIDLVTSALLSNSQEVLSSILVIMANIADSIFGTYRTLIFSNTAYIGGLWLMWMFNPYDREWLVWIILVLLAFGTSGTNLVDNVLIDLFKDIDNSQDEKRSNASAAFWSNLGEVSGAISATMWVANDSIGGVKDSWTTTFLICIIFMMITLVVFARGYKVYHQDELIERPFTIFLRVCRGWFRKLFKSNRRQEDRASTYHKHDMEVVTSLFKIFPVWAAFFVVSLISATGSTFFIEQYNNLSNSKNIPIQIYNLFQAFSRFSIPYLYRWTCSHKNEKVKIGVGMVFSIICCLIAWQFEVNRLNKVRHLDDQNTPTSISFLWLLPQFCVLGCMEGLTEDGLLRFFKSRMKDKELKRYWEELIELVTAFGKLLIIALVLCYSKLGWFGEKINGSQLDKYYRTLVSACSVNFIYYCVIASFCYKNAEETEDTVSDDS